LSFKVTISFSTIGDDIVNSKDINNKNFTITILYLLLIVAFCNNCWFGNKNELFAIKDWQERCLDILKCDIERFRKLLDIPCVTIASHGEYENTLVQTPNNYLTEDTDTYEYLGIKLEAYNKEFIENIACYISDVPVEINNGYRYGVTPFEAIEKNEKIILFLTHPNHWHYSLWNQFKKLVKVLMKGSINKKENFKRIWKK